MVVCTSYFDYKHLHFKCKGFLTNSSTCQQNQQRTFPKLDPLHPHQGLKTSAQECSVDVIVYSLRYKNPSCLTSDRKDLILICPRKPNGMLSRFTTRNTTILLLRRVERNIPSCKMRLLLNIFLTSFLTTPTG